MCFQIARLISLIWTFRTTINDQLRMSIAMHLIGSFTLELLATIYHIAMGWNISGGVFAYFLNWSYIPCIPLLWDLHINNFQASTTDRLSWLLIVEFYDPQSWLLESPTAELLAAYSITQPVRTLFLFKSIWTRSQGSQGCQKIRFFFYK